MQNKITFLDLAKTVLQDANMPLTNMQIWEKACQKGLDKLHSIILMDAPDDPNERLRFEAAYFIGQDTEVENVKPLEKHLARVINGDMAATTLNKLLDKYGIKFVATKGQREESILGSYTDTYSIAKVHGEKCLDFIFFYYCKCWME